MNAEQHAKDKAAAMVHFDRAISLLDDQVGNDPSWVKIRTYLLKQRSHMSAEWQYLPFMPYAEYLSTHHWKEARHKALERAKNRCQICNGSEALQTHHRTYANLGVERDDDLIVLCDGCHSLFHERRELAEKREVADMPRAIVFTNEEASSDQIFISSKLLGNGRWKSEAFHKGLRVGISTDPDKEATVKLVSSRAISRVGKKPIVLRG